jgi:phosphoribosyl 1,2-cyclic phosphodiesterase
MQVQFCGTRGSTPVSSAEQSRYGGYTACIALAHTGEPPTIILDAGTGLQQLSLALRGQAFCGTILLSHLHWDHTRHALLSQRHDSRQPGRRVPA